MKSECIDFHQLPRPNELFVSYLRDFERVSSFYPAFPVSADQLDKRAEKVRRAPHFPRDLLIPVLRRINGAYSGDEAVEHSLKKLASEDTLAVVTGQQVGLFGGPSFGVYKAATAVRVAQYLESNGYSPTAYFLLPEYCWLDNYYRPLQSTFDDFLKRNHNSKDAMELVSAEKAEIALYEKYKSYYSYGVYIAKKLD